MNKYSVTLTLVLIIVVLPVTAVIGDTPDGRLSVAAVVQRVLESDPGIISSRYRASQARERLNLSLSGVRPRVDLEIRPYSFDRRLVPPATPESAIVRTHEVGAGLAVRQPLSTSGVLSAELDHRMRRIESADGSDRWEQQPELTFRWNQPLLGGGELIGNRVFTAGLRDAEIDFEQAEIRFDVTRNDTVRDALELYVQTGNLRRSLELLEETIELLRLQLESAELDRRQGLISDTALLALQVTLNNRRDALFSTRLQLVQVEQLLARAMGAESIEGVSLEDLPSGFPAEVTVPAMDEARRTLGDNPFVRIGELAVEQTEQRAVAGTAVDQPALSVFARTRPVYTSPRANPDSFPGSFTDLGAGGSELELTAGLALTIPLLTAQQREYRTRIDDLTRRNALVDLSDTENILENRLRTLFINRRFLEERLELLAVEIDYERRRTGNEQTLLDAGVTTELRVREVELDLWARRNEQSRIQAGLFLNSLDILNVLGRDLAALLVHDGVVGVHGG